MSPIFSPVSSLKPFPLWPYKCSCSFARLQAAASLSHTCIVYRHLMWRWRFDWIHLMCECVRKAILIYFVYIYIYLSIWFYAIYWIWFIVHFQLCPFHRKASEASWRSSDTTGGSSTWGAAGSAKHPQLGGGRVGDVGGWLDDLKGESAWLTSTPQIKTQSKIAWGKLPQHPAPQALKLPLLAFQAEGVCLNSAGLQSRIQATSLY